MWEYRKEVIESKDIESKDIVKEMDKFGGFGFWPILPTIFNSKS